MDDEVTALLSIQSEESIQQQLLGTVTNVVSFRQIAEELEKKGFHHDFKQCRDKTKALMIPFPVIIIQWILLWSNDRYVTSVYGTNALWKFGAIC